MWLVAIWLARSGKLPDRTGDAASLYALADLTGRPGVLAASAVAAYLLGSVSLVVGRRFVEFVIAHTPRLRNRREVSSQLALAPYVLPVVDDLDRRYGPVAVTRAIEAVLVVSAQPPHSDAGTSADDGGSSRRVVPLAQREAAEAFVRRPYVYQALLAAVFEELQRIARRLRGQHNELYDEYDRLTGEADFRTAIAPALLAVASALAWIWTPLWLAGTIAVPVLAAQAWHQRRAAEIVVVDALLVGRVASPLLERMTAMASELQQELHDREVRHDDDMT